MAAEAAPCLAAGKQLGSLQGCICTECTQSLACNGPNATAAPPAGAGARRLATLGRWLAEWRREGGERCGEGARPAASLCDDVNELLALSSERTLAADLSSSPMRRKWPARAPAHTPAHQATAPRRTRAPAGTPASACKQTGCTDIANQATAPSRTRAFAGRPAVSTLPCNNSTGWSAH